MTNKAFQILRFAYTAAPVLAGLDKFFNILTNWEKYVAPPMMRILPVDAMTYMRIMGVIEILAGILVAVKPKWGSVIVAAWLILIVINLLMLGEYFDVALRDFGLFLGALALAVMTREQKPETV